MEKEEDVCKGSVMYVEGHERSKGDCIYITELIFTNDSKGGEVKHTYIPGLTVSEYTVPMKYTNRGSCKCTYRKQNL